MNATQRKDDGTWVALSNEQIVKLRKLQDAVYMAELDKHVRELGYGVRYEKNHIELAHVTREQIDVFSKRSAQVVSALAERGKERASASHAQRQMLTLATREQKTADLTRDELFRHWVIQAREAGMVFTHGHEQSGPGRATGSVDDLAHESTHKSTDDAKSDPAREPTEFVANAALGWAIKHLSERESLMPESGLLAMAVRHASGKISPTGIQGMAGTGKSYALQTAKELLERQGMTMMALAPYGSQVNNLRGDGIAAKTVSSFLNARDKQRAEHDMGPKTVVVIDEAGVIPVRQMDKLLAQVRVTGAKIVTLGDTAQTKAVEAGRAFALLQEQGMKTVVMGDIQRQQSARLREAVTLAATGRASESLKLLDDVVCIPDAITTDEHGGKTRDGRDRYDAIAGEYANLTQYEQAKTLIVTGTNSSRQAINERVHELLGLKGQGKTFALLNRHDTTRAERQCAKYYTVGDIIQPERDYRCGLQRGQLYQVVERDEHTDRITVVPYWKRETSNLETSKQATDSIDINLRSLSKLSVYQEHRSELSPGDWVRITRNDAALDLVNGQRLQVVAVSESHVTLQTGIRRVDLPANKPLHMDHAYATTAHSAQGLTCDRVLYNAESHSRTTAQDTYYVSISRERHSVKVFTNDETMLPKAVSTERAKELALDLDRESGVNNKRSDYFDGVFVENLICSGS